MEDKEILELYNVRSENAISETMSKYHGYLFSISNGILHDDGKSEEVLNDTYLKAWNVIPPEKPRSLSAFLGKIARNLSLDRIDFDNAKKRGGGVLAMSLDELEEVVASNDAFDSLEMEEITEIMNSFLENLDERSRKIFMRRYWYFDSITDISIRFSLKESNVKTILFRLREKLKEELSKEGYRYEK